MDHLDSLPKDLADKLRAAQRATSQPCPVCKAGRGKFCQHREAKA